MVRWTPLRFTPLYRQYLWGGHRFQTMLGRPLDSDQIYSESWEICDHEADQSVVTVGPLAGQTLHELVRQHGRELMGQAGLLALQRLAAPRFPLLLKYLDANQNLSLQVHPNDALAARRNPPDLGKTEAWVVVESAPGSVIYAGLKSGVDRATFAAALADGDPRACLHSFETRPGDCLLIPAGMVHSLGQGSLVAEIQQASDTTFRLFDWNRPGPDGKPRELHIQPGLEAVDFRLGPGMARRDVPEVENVPTELVRCDRFVLVRHVLTRPKTLGGDDRFRLLTVLEGQVALDGDPTGQGLSRGQSALLPAALGATAIRPAGRTIVLEAMLP